MTTALSSVLIVDDEPAVRDLMSRWVASLGLRAQTAANADEALASLRHEHYDLAVIDVMMPGTTVCGWRRNCGATTRIPLS